MSDLIASPELGELFKALAAAQGKFPKVKKGSENPFFKSKYADLSDVVTAAAPIAAEHGLSVVQIPGNHDGHTTLKTILGHESGQFIGDEMELFMGKADAQSQGSAITYARRYAYCAILGIVTGDDDDGNAATASSKAHGNARPAPRPEPEPVPNADPLKEAKAQLGVLVKSLPPAQQAGVRGELAELFGPAPGMDLAVAQKAIAYVVGYPATRVGGGDAEF